VRRRRGHRRENYEQDWQSQLLSFRLRSSGDVEQAMVRPIFWGRNACRSEGSDDVVERRLYWKL
jgi:hypothetical protein